MSPAKAKCGSLSPWLCACGLQPHAESADLTFCRVFSAGSDQDSNVGRQCNRLLALPPSIYIPLLSNLDLSILYRRPELSRQVKVSRIASRCLCTAILFTAHGRPKDSNDKLRATTSHPHHGAACCRVVDLVWSRDRGCN